VLLIKLLKQFLYLCGFRQEEHEENALKSLFQYKCRVVNPIQHHHRNANSP
jgi:hypothetical protein